ncbi:dienelactone hydrolase family protein [Flavobacterium sp. SUN052]|uniref:dienelactone hydrolase family protein n=1 Tax=Flavobacterium sp. SUN052 TaxID=3002441 RepID=UPI00237E76AD|nr:dienelactone hydrolase family protein [Flavobacterium sp. SUN052]MEC4005216.1 dienelactone hydrolase family protein [Flavobacterium sp. SUN052]
MKTKFTLVLVMLAIIPTYVSAQLISVDYSDGTQKLSGFFSKPKKELKNKPGILILPAWMGIDDHAKESATDLSKLGYNTFVADIYGVGNKPTNFQEAGQKAGYYKKNIQEYQKRIQLALDELVKQGANPDEIVVMGYCFGGTGAIEAARSNMKVKGIVSFHGGLGHDEARTIEPISARVLVLHGADDPYESEAEIKAFQNEMRTAKADWEMVYYANAVHSFTDKNAGTDNSKGAAYNEKAYKRSWKALLQFLKEVL